MKIKEIVSALERFAPLPLQDGFDNAGLQVGLTEAEATGALLCLDVTEAVVDEAVMLGYNLIISHHPLIFKGYKSIIGRDYIERCVLKAIKNDIVIYSAQNRVAGLQAQGRRVTGHSAAALINKADYSQGHAHLGVIGFIYESRGTVTCDAAALCLKSDRKSVV